MSEKEWAFDRYRDGVRMAQGCRVHASTKDEAIQKARQLFDYEDYTFVERAKPSPAPEAAPAECLCDEYGKDLCTIHNVQPEAASTSEPQQGNKHSIQTGPINSSQAIEGLTRIFGDLQHDFHDQWDWMNAEFYLNILCTELAQLRARVAILDAQEVKLPELPKPLRNSKFWDEGIEWRIAGERAARLEREAQLLDAQRAAQAWREVAESFVGTLRTPDPKMITFDHDRLTAAIAAYDALAGKGE